MSASLTQHAEGLHNHFGDRILNLTQAYNEITIEVAPQELIGVCQDLHDQAEFAYQELIDLCGVDYSQFGRSEWATDETSTTGFSRGVEAASMGRLRFGDELEAGDDEEPRYASVMQ